jgi:hypothetical protein
MYGVHTSTPVQVLMVDIADKAWLDGLWWVWYFTLVQIPIQISFL